MKYSILALFLGALLFSSCTKKQSLSKAVVLKIDSIEMTTEEFSKALTDQLKHLDAFIVKDPEYVDRVKSKVVKDFIIKAISELWAGRQGVFVRPEEINAEIDKIRADYGDDISFREELAKEQMTLKEWKEKIRARLLQQKIMAQIRKDIVEPEESELKSYYKNHKDDFSYGESIKIRQVVLKSESDAKVVLKKLKQGVSLAELAKYSVAPEAQNKGDLGWVQKGVSKAFDKAFKVKVGRYSGIVESEYGFHIIQVLGKRPKGTAAFDKVKKEIKSLLMEKREQAKYMAWLDQQIRSVKVFKNDEIIKEIKVVTEGNS